MASDQSQKRKNIQLKENGDLHDPQPWRSGDGSRVGNCWRTSKVGRSSFLWILSSRWFRERPTCPTVLVLYPNHMKSHMDPLQWA
ncbi:hypothetical protein Nepgr_013877 [Nepenthes gracilis]|uniref:Uncharacterized protein n=1 Tax=Nepenthes gracilis TaxID=150966 RepID=A0AAD3SJY5_NEPGR|nr:hypothetical protein Nepgr_013877 [Nepenthes gracilis]